MKITANENDINDIARSLQFNLQCTGDDNRSYRNVCNMSLISFSLAVIFIIRLFSTSAFRVPRKSLSFVFLGTCMVSQLVFNKRS